MKTLPLITLFLITLLGLFLRIYQIGNAPHGMISDEVSFGYNAYSILQTGKDEFGNKMPLSFKSFGDYKYPAYVYASVIPVKVLGLSSFSVRLVSIVSGTLLILVVFLLLRQLGFNYTHSLIGALITAASPWTVVLSRFAFESNLGLFIMTVGLLFLILGINKNKFLFFILAGIFFGLTWYCYLPFRVVSLLLPLCFTVYLGIRHKLSHKYIVVLFCAFILTVAPLSSVIFSKAGTNRISQNSMFTNPQVNVLINESRTFCTEGSAPKIFCYLNANKPLAYARIVVSRYVDMLSIQYLFLTGETQRYLSIENFGLLPFVLIPFYLAGFFYLLRKKNTELKSYFPFFLIAGLFITGLPSSVLPTEPIRTQLAAQYPFILLLILYGISSIDLKSRSRALKPILAVALMFIGFVYIFNYVNIHVKKYANNWGYIEPLMVYLGKQDSNIKIYLKPFIGESLVFYAFYNKVPPAEYQKTVELGPVTSEGFQHVVGLRNIKVYDKSYTAAACEAEKSSERILYVTDQNLNSISGHEVRPLKIEKSISGVSDLSYVYNAKDFLSSNTVCK